MWGSVGATILMAISSLCSSVAFMAPPDACCISSAMWNKTTNSIAEYQSTPKGWMCPNITQDVFLHDRGDFKQSAIFMCYDKYAHSCFKGGIVSWNWIPAQGCGCRWGRHFFGVVAKGCNDVFVCERIQEVVTILWHNFKINITDKVSTQC